MTPRSSPDVMSIFGRALELEDDARRAAYLNEACADAPAVRAEIEELLVMHQRAGRFLNRPACVAPELTGAYEPLSEGPGSRVGPYKLLQQIGEGGMGTVFMAEQEEPVRRKVALKIIKPGMDSKQVVARFEAERQALAMMDHTNIARVLDAGTTESGRPYFVMELVHGIPIVEFCDANKLTPRERLELFVSVCQAIQHAHMKGIIHRDIKPSNVLVTMYDDKPVPKVIDFGVAKAVEQRLTERTLFTQYGALVGTFEYMSPEQAEMNAFGVDTRSDVYSLGVLMYELLTGTTPLERTRLREAAFGEIVRLIKEEEPPRPSVRLSTSGMLAKVAAARKTEPAKLSSLIRGELDWIVMKSLEKDRSRRYETATGLAKDVQRYLAGDTVEACPPTLGYRLRKMYRRNRAAVLTAASFAAVLLAATSVSLAFGVLAKRAESDAVAARNAEAEQREEATRRRDMATAAFERARLTQEQQAADQYAWDMQVMPLAMEHGNTGEMEDILARHIPQTGEKDRRGFEWYYWYRQIHAYTRETRLPDEEEPRGQFAPIRQVSEDGRYLIRMQSSHPLAPAIDSHGRRNLPHYQYLDATITDLASTRPITKRIDLSPLPRDATLSHLEWKFAPDHKRIIIWRAVELPRQDFQSPLSYRVFGFVWDLESQKPVISFDESHVQALSDREHLRIAFSADSRRFAVLTRTWKARPILLERPVVKLAVWDLTTGERFTRLPENLWMPTIPFTADGSRILTTRGQENSLNDRVSVWDLATGEERLHLDLPRVLSSRFTPDGEKVVVIVSDNPVDPKTAWISLWKDVTCTLKLFDAGSGDGIKAIPLPSLPGYLTDHFEPIVISPDGTRFAVKRWLDEELHREYAGYAFDILMGDLKSGRLAPTFFPPRLIPDWQIQGFSPDGKWLALSDRHLLHLVDMPTGAVRKTLSSSKPQALSAWFSPDSQRVMTLQGSVLREWAVPPSSPDRPEPKDLTKADLDRIFSRPRNPPALKVPSEDGQFSVDFDPVKDEPTLRIWNSGGELIRTFAHPALTPLAEGVFMQHHLEFSPDGRRLLCARHQMGRGGKKVTGPDGEPLPSTWIVWDIPSGDVLYFDQSAERPRSVPGPQFMGNKYLVTEGVAGSGNRSNEVLQVFNLDTRREQCRINLLEHTDGSGWGISRSPSLSLSPDSKLILGLYASNPACIVIWNAETGAVLVRKDGVDVVTGLAGSPAWHPNGAGIAFFTNPSQPRITLYDTNTLTELQSFTLGGPEGSRWNEFPGSNRYGRDITFSPDGSRIAACVSLDPPLGGKIMMWDTSNGKQVLNIKIRGDEKDRSTRWYPGQKEWKFGFTPDGHQLQFKSFGRPLRILDARPVPEATR